jgi:hypothetical protein
MRNLIYFSHRRTNLHSILVLRLLSMTTILITACEISYSQVTENLPSDVAIVFKGIHGSKIIAHACELCDPNYKGREAGTSGVRKSADYIINEFHRMGLRPGGSAGSYFQQFKITVGYQISSDLEVRLGNTSIGQFKRGQDYMPIHIPGGKAQIAVDCILAGYGLSIPGVKFDEYSEIEVKGKAVIVFTGVPWARANSLWPSPTTDQKLYNTLSYKARNAAAHGAVCLIVVDNPVGWRKKLSIPEQLRLPETEFPVNSPIPIIHVTRDFLAEITAMSIDELRMYANDIYQERIPQSMLIRGRKLCLKALISGNAQIGRNIIGIIPGRDELLRNQAIVIGAHYDHLGINHKEIYFGANDNAAGVGAMLEIAQAFSRMPKHPKRTIIFIAFDAEEIGKRGSKYYISHPCLPLNNTVLMINFDMIGRNDPGEIKAVGTRSSKELHILHQQLNRHINLRLTHPESYRLGRSDHTAFYYAGVPIMYLFGGLDPDYNTPGDTPDKLIPHKVEKVAKLAFLTAQKIAEQPERIRFDSTAEPSSSWLD